MSRTDKALIPILAIVVVVACVLATLLFRMAVTAFVDGPVPDVWFHTDTVDTGLTVRDGPGPDIGIEMEAGDTIYYYNHELPGEPPQAMGCSLRWVCDDNGGEK